MNQFFKSILKKIFDPIYHRLGYKNEASLHADMYVKDNLLKNFYGILKQINFKVTHIVDVGANHGTWTRETLKYFPEAYFTLLEPQAQLQHSISDIIETNPKVKFHAVGAGIKEGVFKFTIVDRDDSCSFSYTEEHAKNMGFKQVEIPVITLNDFLPATNLPIPEIIKIDAEGLDLEVLGGATHFFGKTEVFMVEAAVMNNIYQNSVLKMMVFMDENGYRLCDFTDLNRTVKQNALWLVEMVFIKKNGIIHQAINFYD